MLPDNTSNEPVNQSIIHRLSADHTDLLLSISREASWIGKTWGGPSGLAASGYAWGAIINNKLVSIVYFAPHFELTDASTC